MLRECAFDMGKPPPPLRPIFKLGDTIICTPGNLTTILAQAKVGKSAFVQAGMAAAMTLSETTADTLGIKGRNEDGKAFIYIDTEQAPYDFWHGIDRARKRALLQDVPAWCTRMVLQVSLQPTPAAPSKSECMTPTWIAKVSKP